MKKLFALSMIILMILCQGVLYADCQGRCGDANGDCRINISDVIYLINYVFILGGPPPGECCAGGWEGQGGDCCPF